MKVLFDECIPRPLRGLLGNHAITTAQEMGWGRLENGELIRKSEESGFDAFVTGDQNLRYQQNLAARRIAILLLSTNYWPTLRDNKDSILAALESLKPGEYREVLF